MSVSFNGGSDYGLRQSSGLVNADNISITCWCRPNSLSLSKVIAAFYSTLTGGEDGYELVLFSDGTVHVGIRSGSTEFFGNTSQLVTSATAWVPIVVTWEITPSNLLRIYVNNSSPGTLDFTPGGFAAGHVDDIQEIMVGGYRPLSGETAPSFFSSQAVDNVGFWNRILTGTEITNFISNRHSCYKIAQDFGVGHNLVFCPLALCEGATAPMVPSGTDSGITFVGTSATVSGPGSIVYPSVATELASAAAMQATMAGTLTSANRKINFQLAYQGLPVQVLNGRWHTTSVGNRITRDEGLATTSASGVGSVTLTNETAAVGSPLMFFFDTSDGTIGQSPIAKHWCAPVLIEPN